MQRRAFLSAAGVGTAALSGCLDVLFGGDDEPDGQTPGGGDRDRQLDPTPASVVVTIRDSRFDPRNLSVDLDTTVQWSNQDAVEHTVTAASDNWDVDLGVPVDHVREYTFDEHGVYEAYCSIHGAPDLSGMAMKIAVGQASIQDPLPDDDYPYSIG